MRRWAVPELADYVAEAGEIMHAELRASARRARRLGPERTGTLRRAWRVWGLQQSKRDAGALVGGLLNVAGLPGFPYAAVTLYRGSRWRDLPGRLLRAAEARARRKVDGLRARLGET